MSPRRSGHRPEPEAAEPTLEFAGYRLDLAGHCLKDAAGKEIPLRPASSACCGPSSSAPGACSRAISSYNSPPGATRRLTIAASTCRSRACGARSSRTRSARALSSPCRAAGYKFAAAVHEAKLPSRPEPSPQTPPTRSDAAPRAPERRHITALAAELAPAEGGRLPSDPEDLSAMVGAFRRYASVVLTQHGGVIGESHGREILAYFGYPTAQENDAERAVRAALAIQRALTEHQRRQREQRRAGAFSTHRPRLWTRGCRFDRRGVWRRAECRCSDADRRRAGNSSRHHQRSAPGRRVSLSPRSAARANSLAYPNLSTCSASCARAAADVGQPRGR